ncbi:unnamed protein product [Boreogadus saida]
MQFIAPSSADCPLTGPGKPSRCSALPIQRELGRTYRLPAAGARTRTLTAIREGTIDQAHISTSSDFIPSPSNALPSGPGGGIKRVGFRWNYRQAILNCLQRYKTHPTTLCCPSLTAAKGCW